MITLDIESLAKFPILTDATPEILQRLLDTAVEKFFEPGEILLQEDSTGREILLILDGLVEVVKGQWPDEVKLSERGACEIMGEMGFIEDRPRFATVRALQPTHVLEFSEASLRQTLAVQPELLFHTTQLISARLRDIQQQMIADLKQKNRELEQAYNDLKRAQQALIEKERLERELELAREMQQSILPHHFPRLPGFDCAARSQPARQVGGDFYDVFTLKKGLVGLVMADVSDKGMPAALFMALTRSLIRSEAHRAVSPAAVLKHVNQILAEITESNMFVTVFYGIINLEAGTLTYVRAGHDRPLLIRSATGQIDLLSARGFPLGILDELELEEVSTRVAPGDVLILYTDGVTDLNSPQGDFFSIDGLLRVARDAAATHDAQAICDQIFAALDSFQAGAPQYDDMAALVVSLSTNPSSKPA